MIQAARVSILGLLPFVLGACASERSPADAPVAEPTDAVSERDPALGLEELEDRMIAASRVEFEFTIDSEGQVISHLEGRVRWQRDAEFSLVAEGELAGQPQRLELRGDATTLATLAGDDASERWSGARPAELIEAVVLGLTHMGLLHNLAVLAGGMPPDHADGGAREWLGTDDLEFGPEQVRDAGPARPLEFVIVVAAEPVGRATLWLDDRNLPIERRQVVEFPDGEMRVVERYSNFVVER